MQTALVLSGGGAKGSFQIGALQFLYEHNLFAAVICSSSVGSVNAIQLTAGGDPGAQTAAFQKLKDIWEGLIQDDDMYVEADWLAQVSPRSREAIIELFSGGIDFPALLEEVVFFPPFAIGQAVALGIDIGAAVEGLKNAQSVFSLAPTRSKIVANLDRAAVRNSGVELRLVSTSLDSGLVRYVKQDGSVINTDGTPLFGKTLTACAAERKEYKDALDLRKSITDELTKPTGPDTGDRPPKSQLAAAARQATRDVAAARAKLDRCLESAPSTSPVSVDVVDGVMASAGIPCVFPPVTLGEELYVDGGVRWVLPLKAAIDLSPDRIVAINASPAGVPSAKIQFVSANLLDIAERTVADILLWETQERQLEVAHLETKLKNITTWVITPNFEVHDVLTIDPGLTRINMGYGFMCAADVVGNIDFSKPPEVAIHLGESIPDGVVIPGAGSTLPPLVGAVPPARWVDQGQDQRLVLLADAIARCRKECWKTEHAVNGARISGGPFTPREGLVLVPSPEALDQLRTMKALLFVLVEARRALGGALPPDAAEWPRSWEHHRWESIIPTPWNEFISQAGTRQAETLPTAFLAKENARPEIYLLSASKHWVTSLAALARIDSRGVAAVKTIPSGYLDPIPTGTDIFIARGALSMFQNADGRLEVVYVGFADILHHNWQVAPGGAWSGENLLGAGTDMAKQIAIGRNADGRLEVVYVGTDDVLFHNWQVAPGGAWSGENLLGAGTDMAKQIAIGRNADGRLEVVYVGTDDVLFHNWQVAPGGAWSGQNVLGAATNKAKQVAIESNADERLEVVYVGTDDVLYHNWQVTAGGAWSGEKLLGAATNKAKQIAIGKNADQRLEVVYVGTDDVLYHNWQVTAGGAWSGEDRLGGATNKAKQIAIGKNTDGRLEVVYVGTDDVLYHNSQVAQGGAWSGESRLGEATNKAKKIAIGNNADGRLEVIYFGTDDLVYHNWQVAPGGAWNGENMLA